MISAAGNCWIHDAVNAILKCSPFSASLVPQEEVALSSYSITATCSGPCACLRSAALLEPIMMASGMAQAVTIITN